MKKGYWIAHVDIDDFDAYQAYIRANAETFATYGVRFVVRGAPQDVREGSLRGRTVVLEFPSLAAAVACYESPNYQAAIGLRTPVSKADLLIIEGWEDPAQK